MRTLQILGQGLFLCLLATLGPACSPPAGEEESKPAVRDLPAIGSVIEAEIGGGVQTYRLGLHRGMFAQIEAMQRGVDVSLVPRLGNGAALPEIDSPNGMRGPERAFLLGEPGGPVLLEVHGGGPRGRYTLRVLELRPASAADRTRVFAERGFAQAENERRERSADSFRRAEEGFLKALGRFQALGDRSRIADVFNRLGRVRVDLGKFEEARQDYEESYRRFLALGSRREAASTLDGLGNSYWLLGDTGRAIVCHERALAIHTDLGDPATQAVSLNNLGQDWDLRGESQNALTSYNRAIELWRALGDQRLGGALANRGRLYLESGDLELAQSDLVAAQPYLEKAPGAARELAGILIDLAEAGFSRGEDIQRLLVRALGLTRRSGDRRSEAVVLNLIGRVAARRGQLAQAAGYHRQALLLFQGLAARREVAATRVLLGKVDLLAGRCGLSITEFARARSEFEAVRDPAGQAAALLGRSRALRCLEDLPGAEREVERVLRRIESLSDKVGGGGLRASLLAGWREAYELAIDLAMSRHARQPQVGHERRAFLLSERARARRLIEGLAERSPGSDCESPPPGGGPSPLERTLTALSRRVSWLGMTGAPESVRRQAATEFERLLAKREALEDRCWRQSLGKTLPEWRRQQRLDAAALDRLLEPGTVLVEFSLGKERSFAWWIRRGAIETVRLPRRDQIEPIARRLRGLIGAGNPVMSRELIARDLATLGGTLLAPLRHQAQVRRLLIVPDGDLFLVPYSALPVHNGEALVERAEIAVLPSVASLLAIRRSTSRRPKPKLELGVLAGPPASRVWDPLPYALSEADAIRRLVPRARRIAATGAAASRGIFFLWPFQRVRLLHFATHAWFDGEHPSLSGLLLAEQNGRDELLQAYEIQRLRLAADLVVLSACETGHGGREVRGEGLVGLAQSFLVAGAGSTVASLWQVHDQATEKMMVLFYTGLLRDGLSPAAALRRAELELRGIDRWRDPYFWAGFLLFGDPDSNKRFSSSDI